MDYYKALGIQEDAPQREIERRFRDSIRHYKENPFDRTKQKAIEETAAAYQILSDREQRKVYDKYKQAHSEEENIPATKEFPASLSLEEALKINTRRELHRTRMRAFLLGGTLATCGFLGSTTAALYGAQKKAEDYPIWIQNLCKEEKDLETCIEKETLDRTIELMGIGTTIILLSQIWYIFKEERINKKRNRIYD